jgi:hypothetical protein
MEDKNYTIKFYMVSGKRDEMDEPFFDVIDDKDVSSLRAKLCGFDPNPWWRPALHEQLDQILETGWEEWVNLNNVESITIEEDKHV